MLAGVGSTPQTTFRDAVSATAVRADMQALLVSPSTGVPCPTFLLFCPFAALTRRQTAPPPPGLKLDLGAWWLQVLGCSTATLRCCSTPTVQDVAVHASRARSGSPAAQPQQTAEMARACSAAAEAEARGIRGHMPASRGLHSGDRDAGGRLRGASVCRCMRRG